IAIQSLAGHKFKKLVQPLCEDLKDPDPVIRREAAGVLVGLTESTKTRGSLFGGIIEEDDRENAGEPLTHNPKTRAVVKLLIEALKDPDAWVRANVAQTVCHFGPAAIEAKAALLEALKDPDKQVRWSAAFALASLGPEARDASGSLLVLLRDPEPMVRGFAVH